VDEALAPSGCSGFWTEKRWIIIYLSTRRESELGFRGKFAVNLGLRADLACAGSGLQHVDVELQKVSGHHGPAELGARDPMKKASLFANSGLDKKSAQAVWAMASTINTPGITGCPGKWP